MAFSCDGRNGGIVAKGCNGSFGILAGSKWIFATKDGMVLYRHPKTKIGRHVKVRGDKSPFDGGLEVLDFQAGVLPWHQPLAGSATQRQQGKCAHCGMLFLPDDLLEVHHVYHAAEKKEYHLEALHRTAMTKFMAQGGRLSTWRKVSMTGVNQLRSRVRGNLSSTVLKTSAGSDPLAEFIRRLIEQAFSLNHAGKCLTTILDDAHLMALANLRKLRLLFEDFPKNHNLVLIGRPNLLAALELGVNQDIKSRVTYSVITKRLNADDMRDSCCANSTAWACHTTPSPALRST